MANVFKKIARYKKGLQYDVKFSLIMTIGSSIIGVIGSVTTSSYCTLYVMKESSHVYTIIKIYITLSSLSLKLMFLNIFLWFLLRWTTNNLLSSLDYLFVSWIFMPMRSCFLYFWHMGLLCSRSMIKKSMIHLFL